MTETVDVQALTIGAGTVLAVALLAFGTVVGATPFGIETTTAAAGAFAATVAALALLQGAWGRYDVAAAYGAAAIGWGLILLGSDPLRTAAGLLALLVGGGYVAVTTVRAREGEPPSDRPD